LTFQKSKSILLKSNQIAIPLKSVQRGWEGCTESTVA
jgi:hypothetical protein